MLKKFISLLLLVIFLPGCVSTSKPSVSQNTSIISSTQEDPIVAVVPIVPSDGMQEEAVAIVSDEATSLSEESFEEVPKGLVFAKTDFSGVLAKAYVQLMIEDLNNPENKVHLLIGDKTQQKALVWDVKTVQPGYFFIELPEGEYHITSVSIPVGSTLATEPVNILFSVSAEKALYLGTLIMQGTKEKINWGGVPLMKPGFEFTLGVANEAVEGQKRFQEIFPEAGQAMEVKLMEIIPAKTE